MEGSTTYHIVTILYELFVIAMVWVPPSDGSLKGSDVSFFYCTYVLVCIGIGLCVLYYVAWALVLPKIFNYERKVVQYQLENGERGQTIIKVSKGIENVNSEDPLAEKSSGNGKAWVSLK